jgi:hypothetical protein
VRRGKTWLAALVVGVSGIAVTASTASAYDVICADGWISHSGGKQGACSSHGGIAGGGGSISTPTYGVPSAPVVLPDVTPPTISLVAGGAMYEPLVLGEATPSATVTLADDRGFPAGVGALVVNWGDGTTATVTAAPGLAANVTVPGHSYEKPGTYTISLSVTDAAGNTGSAVPFTIVVIAPPRMVTRPTVRGSRHAGRTLTCSRGTWTGSPFYTQQWLANGQWIPSAHGRTFRLRTRDASRRISCRVVATNGAGSAHATSHAVRVAKR